MRQAHPIPDNLQDIEDGFTLQIKLTHNKNALKEGNLRILLGIIKYAGCEEDISKQ